MKRFFLLLALICSISFASAQSPRYIFFMIGDGMGAEQVKLTNERPCFLNFPVTGEITTYSADADITDSAAAGTALSTGKKTSNGTVGMSPDHSENYYSIVADAMSAGYGTAIMTSVSLDHATPASFYAHRPSRNDYYEISGFVAESGVNIFAGAGFKDPRENLKAMKKAGYKIVRGQDANINGKKVIWIQDETADQSQLPYKYNRGENDMELPDMLEEVIDALEKSHKKFFVMAEGGMIDWACHDNNAYLARGEVEDFDEAVQEALDFYEDHRSETLIVVTADHETGGLTVNEDGSVSWTTDYHTGANVPVYAIGVGAEKFQGTLNNIDIPNILRTLIK